MIAKIPLNEDRIINLSSIGIMSNRLEKARIITVMIRYNEDVKYNKEYDYYYYKTMMFLLNEDGTKKCRIVERKYSGRDTAVRAHISYLKR